MRSAAAYACVVGLAVLVGATLRLPDLTARPMHHDEANQAVKFGALLETGDYRYDRHDHHGPTLYFLTLPSAWLRGQATLAALDERTLRVVPAVFGVALVLTFGLLAGRVGRPAAAAAALLGALSPALSYYSRFYIQESLFVWCALVFAVCAGRYAEARRPRDAAWAGVFAGLAFATKETSVLVFAAAAVAAVVARPSAWRVPWRHALVALGAAGAVALVFFSSFFRDARGVIESVLAFRTYVDRGLEIGRHDHPWFYYLQVLGWTREGGLLWSEGLILVLAAVGAASAWRRTAGFWPRYLTAYTLVLAVIFSGLRYKTPWNAVPSHAGFVVLAGLGSAWLMTAVRGRAAKAAIVTTLVVAAAQLGLQNVRANGRYAADPRNPYVYAHTTSDYLRLVARVHALSAVHPDGAAMLVKVVAGPYEQWPAPWYLRDLSRVGYWTTAAEAAPLAGTPVIIAGPDQSDATAAALGDAYVTEYYSVRPEVLLTVFIDRPTWERFLNTPSR